MNKPIITFDIEDWLQSTWDRSLPVTKRSAYNTMKLLDLLDEVSVKSTMFVQGKFAKEFPEVVKEISNRNHELACHGFSHIEIFKQTKAQFAEDVLTAKELLQDITGSKIIGFRAPDFSVTEETLWALETLFDLGFIYDSSIFPINGARYGISDWTNRISIVKLDEGKSILELPIGTYRYSGKNYPIGGGGYFRLLPGFIMRKLMQDTLKVNDFIFYCHPYEFSKDEFQEMDVAIPLKTKLHQGIGRGAFRARFVKMIERFGGQRISDFLDSAREIESVEVNTRSNILYIKIY